MRRAIQTTLPVAVVLAPSMALAHAGHGYTSGLMHGFTHPITGIDHILAMVAVGVLAAQLGGRDLWLLPLSFAGVMTIAGISGMAGIQLPFSEFGIAVSVVVLGLAVTFPRTLPALGSLALVGLFGMFHGYVHGAAMPSGASGATYAMGFLGATALLIGLGIVFGLMVGSAREELGLRVVRAAGSAIALCGIAILSAPF